VTVRSPEAAAQSGDALAVVGGGAQNTAEARVTSAQAPAEAAAIVKQEAGSGTAAGVRGLYPQAIRRRHSPIHGIVQAFSSIQAFYPLNDLMM
jgi:hypothetical protein